MGRGAGRRQIIQFEGQSLFPGVFCGWGNCLTKSFLGAVVSVYIVRLDLLLFCVQAES